MQPGIAAADAFGPAACFGTCHFTRKKGDVEVGIAPATVVMIHPEFDAAAYGNDIGIRKEGWRCGAGPEEEQGEQAKQKAKWMGGAG
ncbi:hypothetical protein GCM10023213_03430 [Prosthecobacter algae]|uniref:Uncharacterized protein n=1 Tax=Prosthecobacter algae TaxID=1144682 RepID=A0ABP9NZF8_9BACT